MRDPVERILPAAAPAPGLMQPVAAGVLAALTGFASSFAILLAGFTAAGASPAQAASGLFAVCLTMGLLSIVLSLRWRMPVMIAWSTPGAALLVASGAAAGSYPVAVGAFVAAALLIVAAGLWQPFGRAVAAIPLGLANAMLAGVLLELCLAPVKAAAASPHLALPIIAAWALGWRFARRYAMVIALLVAAMVILAATPGPGGIPSGGLPSPTVVLPAFTLHAVIGIGLPLFLVTMASQNLPGLAVMRANGYELPVRPVFVTTGLASVATAFLGGHSLNLAAITAALCAGPEAHPEQNRRWIASVACGATYVLLALAAGAAAAFIHRSPPLLIEAVAGLALLGSLGSALSAALDSEGDRLPAIFTFVTTASGVTLYGIGAAFWGLLAGGLLMALFHRPR
jgi:benzoate membrane transport protein